MLRVIDFFDPKALGSVNASRFERALIEPFNKQCFQGSR